MTVGHDGDDAGGGKGREKNKRDCNLGLGEGTRRRRIKGQTVISNVSDLIQGKKVISFHMFFISDVVVINWAQGRNFK